MTKPFFSHFRFAGEVKASDIDSFMARLTQLRSESAGLWVSAGPTAAGFQEMIIAGDFESGGKLQTLLSDFGLHWKTVLIDPLTRLDGSIDDDAIAKLLQSEGVDSGIQRLDISWGLPEGAHTEIPNFVGGSNMGPGADYANAEQEIVVVGDPLVTARLAADFERMFGKK